MTGIPGDVVSNGVLIASVFAAKTPEPMLSVTHQCCSQFKKKNVRDFMSYVHPWIAHNPSDKAVLPHSFTLHDDYE